MSELFLHQYPDRVCGLKVLLEDPFGATSAPSELFRLFYQLSVFALSLLRSIGPPDFLTALSFLDTYSNHLQHLVNEVLLAYQALIEIGRLL